MSDETGSAPVTPAKSVPTASPRTENQVLVVFTILLPLGIFAAAWFIEPGWSYMSTAGVLTLFLAMLGYTLTGSPFGVLISERNLMSLSRFQAVVWTVIVLAGYLTMVVARVRAGTPDATSVSIPQELWWAMGISSTSLLGTPLLQAAKRLKTPDAKLLQSTASQLGENPESVETRRQGTLYANASVLDARMADIFQGDEVGDTAHIDLAKVQMFYFTAIAAVSYFVDLSMAVRRGETQALPALSQGFVALLAISHGGYLVSKSTDHSNARPT
ncbi:hypothetical protein LZ198_13155 [Myxococcus sp. K15C18031901]|uniref:hypothetical protein n=1 Tax=Myxococcus dinghuensis TaxID=2906761 RepID=UPI0020A7CB6B|nr:hypothetical protein [Myxococcus dinghuensis]MCP3099816.1 hypothetical protein [Myxococcus dinghuensis]